MSASVTCQLARLIINDPNKGISIPTFQVEGRIDETVLALFREKGFDIGRILTITRSKILKFQGEAAKFTGLSIANVLKAVRAQAEASHKENIHKESLDEEKKRETENGWNLMIDTAKEGHTDALQALQEATAQLTEVQLQTGITVQLIPHQTP